MVLYIIRHAQSYNNALANWRDRVADPELTDLGRRQADILARHLAEASHPEQRFGRTPEETGVESVRGYGISRLYCSPMYRALQTAMPVATTVGVDPEVWIDIHESGGIFLNHPDERGTVGYPGMTREEIGARFPSYRLPEGITGEGWWDVKNGEEDWAACQGRAIKVAHLLREWAGDGDSDTVAMISHAGFIGALIKALMSQLPGHGVVYHHFNTAITRVDFRADRRLDIRYINRIPHLSNELVS